MERSTEIIKINNNEDIPSVEWIRSFPSNKRLILVFEKTNNYSLIEAGNKFKNEFKDFLIGVNNINSEITIDKLITEEEIETNQDLFEKYAKDYRRLSEHLIFKLAEHLKVSINSEFPLSTFRKSIKKQRGKIKGWNYFLHGYHCFFENEISKQTIEVPLVFSLEFGDLDPYFFTSFIISSKEYHPLPFNVHSFYHDGDRIIEKMISLGKFERITSNIENHFGVVVVDREKVSIDIYNPERIKKETLKFNFWGIFKPKP